MSEHDNALHTGILVNFKIIVDVLEDTHSLAYSLHNLNGRELAVDVSYT